MPGPDAPAFSFDPAGPGDLDAALPVIREFYAHFGFPWDEERKRSVLREMLGDPARGRLFLIRRADTVVGYALLAFYLSLEFDGPTAILDEFFVQSACRGGGLGGRALVQLLRVLADQGIRVARLEIDDRHPEAASLYARHGFRPDGRRLWTRRTGDLLETD